MRLVHRPIVALVLAVGAGCSGDSGDADDGASLGATLPPTQVTAPAVPAAGDAGTGVVVVGGASSSFAVTDCQLDPTGEGSTLVLVRGEGTTAGGIPFRVEAQRFSTNVSAETFTDTIAYSDTARILQIQRFEVAGEVTDIRDPDARGTLLRTRPDGLSATGVAGPPGSGGEDLEGLVGLALDARC